MRAGAVAVVLLCGGCAVFGPRVPAVDVNAADPPALAAIPHLSPTDAERIVAHRPYAAKEDLLRRHVLDERTYSAVADRLYVGPPGMPDYLGWTPPLPQGP